MRTRKSILLGEETMLLLIITLGSLGEEWNGKTW